MDLRPSLLLAAAAALLLGGLVTARAAPAEIVVMPVSSEDERLHFQLDRSQPAADTVVPPPGEVRLWFSQGAQEDATSIRVLDASGEPVPTGDLWSSEARDEHAVALSEPLAPGGYTVAWRSMAADGHVVRGDFTFTVRTQE